MPNIFNFNSFLIVLQKRSINSSLVSRLIKIQSFPFSLSIFHVYIYVYITISSANTFLHIYRTGNWFILFIFVHFTYSREIFNTQWLQFRYSALCVMQTLMIAYKMMNSAQQFVRAESKASEFMYGEACSILKSIDFLMVIASKDRALYTGTLWINGHSLR